MPKKLILAAFALILSLSFPISAQEKLIPGGKAPVADGKMETGEYSFTKTAAGMWIGFALSEDGKTLYSAITANTVGWVSHGFGSKRMDGSAMFMAYEAGGKQYFSVQKGRGNSHSEIAGAKAPDYSVKSSGGAMTLEFSLPAADYLSGGELVVISAYGQGADFKSKHKAYSSFTVKLGQ